MADLLLYFTVTFCLHLFFISFSDLTLVLLSLSSTGLPPRPSSISHLPPSLLCLIPPACALEPQLTSWWVQQPLQLTHSLSLHLLPCLPPALHLCLLLLCPHWAAANSPVSPTTQPATTTWTSTHTHTHTHTHTVWLPGPIKGIVSFGFPKG